MIHKKPKYLRLHLKSAHDGVDEKLRKEKEKFMAILPLEEVEPLVWLREQEKKLT